MACGSQSRGLNSVRCFPEPVLLPARRSPPPGGGATPRGSRQQPPPRKAEAPQGLRSSLPSSLFFRNHPPPLQPPRLPEVEAGGCHSHSTSVVLLVTGFSSSVTRASRKIPDAAS